MSGGKRQLLGLALIVARETPLILLDEPTSSLDLRWQLDTLSLLRQHARQANALAVIALHDLNLAIRYCDDAILIAEGGCIACGPVEQVITADRLRQVFGVQARIERCSQNRPIVLIDQSISSDETRA